MSAYLAERCTATLVRPSVCEYQNSSTATSAATRSSAYAALATGRRRISDDTRAIRRLGTDLLIDPARWDFAASDLIGARAIVVQDIDERAKSFHGRFGFRPFSECGPLMLLLRTSELAVLLEP